MMRSEYVRSIIPDLSPYEVFYYYDGPRFYSCRDLVGQIYIVYWVDQDEFSESWLYLRVSLERYNAMKAGHLSIATTLSEPEENVVYLVQVVDQGFNVNEILADDIDPEWLPELADRLELPITPLPEKVNSASIMAIASHRQVFDIALSRLNNSYEIGCGKLGRILDSVQNTLFALACNPQADIKRVPDAIKDKSEFLATGVFASSFGIRLQSKNGDLFSNNDVAIAAETLALLLTAAAEPETLTNRLMLLNILARSRFKHLIRTLVDSKVSIKTDWGAPSGKSITSRTDYHELVLSLEFLDRSDEAETQIISRHGELVGVDVENDFFVIILNNEVRDVIKGKLSSNLSGRHFEIPTQVSAKLEETCTIDPLTEKEKWSYVLLDVESIL